MNSIEIEGKTINIFGSENTGSPLIVLNTYGNEGCAVWSECQNIGCPPFALAAVSNLNWNADMSPWENPPIYKKDDDFTGGADAYLSLLTTKIIPAVCNEISPITKPEYIGLAGYSLAGLFAIYSAYKTSVFSRIASASGSLWFPHFIEYARSNDFARKIDCVYLSLGDAESKTRNPILKTVQENTQSLYSFLTEKHVAVKYELNSGNHFNDAVGRMARGIKQTLSF